MPTKNESYWTRELSAVLEMYGCMVEAIVGSRMNRSGRPDRYIASKKWHGWLEAKLELAPLDESQKRWHSDLLKRVPNGVYTVRYFPKEEQISFGRYYANGVIGDVSITGRMNLHIFTKKKVAKEYPDYVHGLLNLFANYEECT
jgi:hypothetical protein